jgi:hypothetical protein
MSQWPGKGLGGALESSDSGSGRGSKLNFLDHAGEQLLVQMQVCGSVGASIGFAETRGRRGQEGYK